MADGDYHTGEEVEEDRFSTDGFADEYVVGGRVIDPTEYQDGQWDSDNDDVPLSAFSTRNQAAEPRPEPESDSDDDIPFYILRQRIARNRARNRPPPVAVDTAYATEWLKDYPDTPGPVDCDDIDKPIEAFMKLWPEELFSYMAKETNNYGDRCATEGMRRRALLKDWDATCHTDETEMKAFIGTLIFMGMNHNPKYTDYWATDRYRHRPGFRSIMKRERWDTLNKIFHLADNRRAPQPDSQDFDPYFKVREKTIFMS